MDAEQIRIVKLSMIPIMQKKIAIGTMFYGRLFEIAPELRKMFSTDIETQAGKLIDTLSVAIGTLKDPAALNVILENLARRHAGYGVRDEHYDTVGAALVWTLEQAFGDALTPQLRAAWIALYGNVAATMKNAAASQARAASA